MVLEAILLNTKHYKVKFKGKVEGSNPGKGIAPSHTLSKKETWVPLTIEKGNLWVTFNYGRQLYFYTGSLARWVECSPMVRETWVHRTKNFENGTWYVLA